VELLAAVLAVAALPWCGDGPAMHDMIGGRIDYQCPKIADNQVKAIRDPCWPLLIPCGPAPTQTWPNHRNGIPEAPDRQRVVLERCHAVLTLMLVGLIITEKHDRPAFMAGE
jgi:hypothetical protein